MEETPNNKAMEETHDKIKPTDPNKFFDIKGPISPLHPNNETLKAMEGNRKEPDKRWIEKIMQRVDNNKHVTVFENIYSGLALTPYPTELIASKESEVILEALNSHSSLKEGHENLITNYALLINERNNIVKDLKTLKEENARLLKENEELRKQVKP